ncbi:hypothetical protein JOC95_002745 [Bacillus tianshenii]|uniref:Uncharacterized protein n=1 Tax=Sutcliffiella tianshenii TaxID=1463404 RepID=A0ABS2P1Q0_9BACI|nr:hypothetical protein [Bacillus tianshenii]MBM7620890.1 hypothetical protein [Bacillus tianshenii]
MEQISRTWNLIWFPYVIYIMYFLGVGLISGGIVHMPIEPARYSIILILGSILFISASFVNEFYVEKKKMNLSQAIKLLFFSLLLSLGVGMVSGGIQHFSDLGGYAVILIPSGIVLSAISFIFKNNIPLSTKQAALVIAMLFLLVSPLALTLNWYVDGEAQHESDSEIRNDGHGHGH